MNLDLTAGRKIEQVSIAVTTGVCQLRCVYCPTHEIRRARGLLDPALLARVLDQAAPRVVNLQGYGEPTLHPDFAELIRISKRGGRTVKFFSNLNGWTPELARTVVAEGVDQLIASIDAFDQATYARIRRGGSLDEVRRGVAMIVEEKRARGSAQPELVFNTVVIRDSVDQIGAAFDFAEALGEGQPVFEVVNDYGSAAIAALAETDPLRIRRALCSARERAERLGFLRSLQNIDFNLASLEAARPDRFACHRPWRLLTVLEDGETVPCGEFHEGQVSFGSLARSPLEEVWNGARARAFRAALASGRSRLPVCSACTVNEGATEDLFDPWKETA